MKQKKRTGKMGIAALVLTLIFAVPMFLFMLVSKNRPIQGELIQENAYRYVQERDYWSEITDFGVSGDHIYIVYGHTNLVTCYRTDGSYECTFCFRQGNNGRSTLFRNRDGLYLEHRDNHLYRLENGTITEFHPWSRNDPVIEAIQSTEFPQYTLHLGDDGSTYALRGRSLWRTYPDGREEEIIRRPAWTGLARSIIWWSVPLYAIIGLCSLSEFLDWRKKRRVSAGTGGTS